MDAPRMSRTPTSVRENTGRETRTSPATTALLASTSINDAAPRVNSTSRRRTGSAIRISMRPASSSPAVRADATAIAIADSSRGSISA